METPGNYLMRLKYLQNQSINLLSMVQQPSLMSNVYRLVYLSNDYQFIPSLGFIKECMCEIYTHYGIKYNFPWSYDVSC